MIARETTIQHSQNDAEVSNAFSICTSILQCIKVLASKLCTIHAFVFTKKKKKVMVDLEKFEILTMSKTLVYVSTTCLILKF